MASRSPTSTPGQKRSPPSTGTRSPTPAGSHTMAATGPANSSSIAELGRRVVGAGQRDNPDQVTTAGTPRRPSDRDGAQGLVRDDVRARSHQLTAHARTSHAGSRRQRRLRVRRRRIRTSRTSLGTPSRSNPAGVAGRSLHVVGGSGFGASGTDRQTGQAASRLRLSGSPEPTIEPPDDRPARAAWTPPRRRRRPSRDTVAVSHSRTGTSLWTNSVRRTGTADIRRARRGAQAVRTLVQRRPRAPAVAVERDAQLSQRPGLGSAAFHAGAEDGRPRALRLRQACAPCPGRAHRRDRCRVRTRRRRTARRPRSRRRGPAAGASRRWRRTPPRCRRP